MAVSMIGPKFYAWDRNGKPLAFGKLYTYEARTNVPKPTYQSEDQVIENTNPVILNGEGYANVYLDGSYKMVLKDDKDNEIWSSDPVTSNQAEEWVSCVSASYSSPTSFKIIGNFSSSYEIGKKVRLDSNDVNFEYSTVSDVSYAGGETTVVISEPVVNTGLVKSCVSIVGVNSSFNQKDLSKISSISFENVQEMKSLTMIGGGVASIKEGDRLSTGGMSWEVAASGPGIELPEGFKASPLTDIIVNDFGFSDDKAENTTRIVEALSLASSSAKSSVKIKPGTDVSFNSFEIPSGITFYAIGCTLRTTSANAIQLNPRVVILGYGSRIYYDTTAQFNRLFTAANQSTTNNECKILGFEVFNLSGTVAGRGLDLTSFYQCEFNFTVTGFDSQYYQGGTRSCYYNQITIHATNTNIGMSVVGDLFNGNTINVVRCNINNYGIRLGSSAGNIINVTWIEGCTSYGINLVGSSNTTIVGGVIEGVAGAICGINLGSAAKGTNIIGTSFGREFSSSLRRVLATASCEATTILSQFGNIIGKDGEITELGLGRETFGPKVEISRPQMLGPAKLKEYTVATLPSTSEYQYAIIIVTDDVDGLVPAFSDGSNWRRVTDRQIVSTT